MLYNARRGLRVLIRVKYFSSIMLLATLVVAASAGDPATDRLLKQVENRYNKVATLQVKFAETYGGAGGGGRARGGGLFFRQAGGRRVGWTRPPGKLCLSRRQKRFLCLS